MARRTDRRGSWQVLGVVLLGACSTAEVAPGTGAAPRGGALARPLEPVAGAPSAGDPYYPGLGNGGYDVRHYDVTLDVDMESGAIEAFCSISAEALVDLSSFDLDLHALEVEEVLVDGAAAGWEHEGLELIVHPAAPIRSGAEFVVGVAYGGVPELVPDPAVPFLPGVGWSREESGVYVVSECAGASSWIPCNDHPIDKATFSFTVTVAKPFVVAANGILAEEKDHGEARTYVWRVRDPMATYLATVDIAEFGVIVAEGPGGMPLRTYHPLDATEDELAAFARTPELLEFYAGLFGPYPFDCYGAVISYESVGGALETQTIPVYSRGSSEPVLAHEMAHQWFGDCVSPERWADLWLSEGFATYAEWLWSEHTEGRAGFEETMLRTYDRLRSAEVGPPFDPGVERLFSGRVYVRGAWVLHALRREVGDETFFEILRSWVEMHRNGNGSTRGFVEHCESVAGRELAGLRGALYDPVIPAIPEYDEELAARPGAGR